MTIFITTTREIIDKYCRQESCLTLYYKYDNFCSEDSTLTKIIKKKLKMGNIIFRFLYIFIQNVISNWNLHKLTSVNISYLRRTYTLKTLLQLKITNIKLLKNFGKIGNIIFKFLIIKFNCQLPISKIIISQYQLLTSHIIRLKHFC